MSERKITINPITRLEGHDKIEKILEDKKMERANNTRSYSSARID